MMRQPIETPVFSHTPIPDGTQRMFMHGRTFLRADPVKDDLWIAGDDPALLVRFVLQVLPC
jgi:hypothetical protein